EEEEDDDAIFPTTELPGEIAFKIISHFDNFDKLLCRQSLPLDKVIMKWGNDNKIDGVIIEPRGNHALIRSKRYGGISHFCAFRCIRDRIRGVFSQCEIGTLSIGLLEACNESNFRALIEDCALIQCNLLSIRSILTHSCSKVLTNESLRELMWNKKDVNVYAV
ncbi:hypothetical protein PFISCL1PPCAC_22315, partial [Pristionchus fissidentatus]